MVKRLLNLWIFSGFAAILSICCQCKPESDPQTIEIKEYLKKHYNVKLDNNTDRIYLINDIGCGNCVLSLSEFVKRNVNDEKALIIINSRGANVDLSTFEGKKKKSSNIIISHQIKNDETDRFYHSGVIYLKDEKVDTVVNIFGSEIANQLQYIFDREKRR